ncbi:MAG: ATP-binding protein [Pseudomonadota bacterium]
MEQLRDDVQLAAAEAFDDRTEALNAEYLSMQQQLAAVADDLFRARQLRIGELLERERLAERLEHLVEALPGAVLVTDTDGIVTECNASAPAWLGRPLVGASVDEIFARLDWVDCDQAARLRTPDGRWLALSRRQLPNACGELLLLTDDTEAEVLRQHLARQNRLAEMGEMSARLAHQVRTPLSAAVLYLTQAQTYENPPSDYQHYVGNAVERLRDLERLVNDMLLFARGVPAVATPVDIGSVLDDVIDTFEPQLDDPLRLQWTGNDGAVCVNGSRHALFNAVSNLIANAVQFSPADDPIAITLTATDNQVSISIRDHGPGVPTEFQDRIFEPFFSTQSSGTGLGLAVVHSVAQAHGGEISVHDHPDGAEFVLTLPVPASLPSVPPQTPVGASLYA